MRIALVGLMGLIVAACGGEREPNVFPAAAETRFYASCPRDSAACVCTWDGIIRTVTYEEYEAALERFRETGSMDTRITRVKTQCIERNRE